ncbi:Cthe_2314 family HEPN domain-containing protein [Paenibacillus sp. D2_2]|uniref:Cthe_2314 family HEPN domain-containing protein n=1 Tax=Paenibacillus sp. D2_2 TaxID=3073092 RepID=UPI00281565CC|nr:Cthe_2314 family HEPN domain-containing protein [Paenibacillus sp. D2_2]WMT40255.1 Cthe_2314 family HEPN domain-containing protein [Paenibacillus sp. D2_2]
MLRSLLGEPPRQAEEKLDKVQRAMKETVRLLRKEIEQNSDPTHDYRKLEIWILGLISSLDELEECLFASILFRNKVTHDSVTDMEPEEQGNYARYVFFYKDGFIRVFAILDKLGTVLNELFDMKMAKIKPHFSFFTVMRQLLLMPKYADLGKRMNVIKDNYREALSQLRRRRNTEIHYMNSEMRDDLWQRHQALFGKIELEDLDLHIRDLEQGYQMVCETLETVFVYTNQRWKQLAER